MERFSFIEALRCINCGRDYDPKYLLQCEACGGLLDPQYDLEGVRRVGVRDPLFRGLWAYHRVLPVADPHCLVTLGEGDSPLLRTQRLGEKIGVPHFFIKYEGTLPTGTVKDRTSATAVSSALQFGFKAISVVSTGNAGVSIATYARRAGLGCVVFSYEKGDERKMAHMSLMATQLCVYKGEYDDLIEEFDRVMDRKVVFDGGARRNPYKHEGKKTIAYELVHQLGHAPDVLVLQASGCEMLVACYRGFREMLQMGLVEKIPMMVACQSVAANPLVRAFKSGGPVQEIKTGPTLAKGLATGRPGKKGVWALNILRENGGLALDVSDPEILEAQRLLAETEGLWSGPTGSSSLAGLVKGVREGLLDPEACIVCMITETGLTSEYPEPSFKHVDSSALGIEDGLRGFFGETTGGSWPMKDH